MNKLAITASSMQSFLKCQRAWYYRNVLGIKKTKQSDALYFGTEWHNLMECRAKGLGYEDCLQAAFKDKDIDQYVAGMLFGMYGAYCQVYGEHDEWTIKPEQQFSLKVDGSYRFVARGKLDGIGEQYGETIVVEHKTTSDDIQKSGDFCYWSKLRFDIQVLQYYWATVKSLGVKPEVVYDVARKPKLEPRNIPLLDGDGLKVVVRDDTQERVYLDSGKPRQSAGDGMTLMSRKETRDEYARRIYDTIMENPSQWFQRRTVNVLESDVAKFLKIRLAICQQITDNMSRQKKLGADTWTMNMGNRNCDGCSYAPFCYTSVEPNVNQLPEGYELKQVNEELA